jgi:hypothetical protein
MGNGASSKVFPWFSGGKSPHRSSFRFHSMVQNKEIQNKIGKYLNNA